MAGPKKKTAKKGGRRARRDVGSVIKKLDVSSLHKDAITDVMLHCASALNLKKAISSRAESSASYCYTKSGSSSTVSIWSGGFKVGESSEAAAKASGIPPCG
jgi:hypothetical protein